MTERRIRRRRSWIAVAGAASHSFALLWIARPRRPCFTDWMTIVTCTASDHTFKPRLVPRDAIACSSDADIRRLVAVLIPFNTDTDTDAVRSLAHDKQWSMRRGLAQAIENISCDHSSASASFCWARSTLPEAPKRPQLPGFLARSVPQQRSIGLQDHLCGS